jgi:hypothetical protein
MNDTMSSEIQNICYIYYPNKVDTKLYNALLLIARECEVHMTRLLDSNSPPSSQNGANPRDFEQGGILRWKVSTPLFRPVTLTTQQCHRWKPQLGGGFVDIYTFITLLESLLDMVRLQEVLIRPRIHVRIYVLKPSHNLFLSIESIYWPKPSWWMERRSG